MSKKPPQPDFNRVINEARKKMGTYGHLSHLPFVAFFTGFAGWTLYNSVYFVQGGCRAVKFNAITGLFDKTYGEGANLAIPYIETPVVFDVRSRPTEVVTSSGSKDLQMVNMAVRVLFQPSVENLHHIYRDLGVNYPETVLPSLINEIIKAVIANFNAADLLIKRPEVTARIQMMLRERAQKFNIDITDVSITQMSFGKEYTNAVESKQIAQQMAERAKFRVEQAEQEKLGMIILADGEAQSATLIGEAMHDNPGFLELRRLEAAKLIAKVVSQGKGQYYLNADSLLLNPGMNNDNGGGNASNVAAAPKKSGW